MVEKEETIQAQIEQSCKDCVDCDSFFIAICKENLGTKNGIQCQDNRTKSEERG